MQLAPYPAQPADVLTAQSEPPFQKFPPQLLADSVPISDVLPARVFVALSDTIGNPVPFPLPPTNLISEKLQLRQVFSSRKHVLRDFWPKTKNIFSGKLCRTIILPKCPIVVKFFLQTHNMRCSSFHLFRNLPVVSISTRSKKFGLRKSASFDN